MPIKDFYLNAPLTIVKGAHEDDEDPDVIKVSGYASTNDKDRDGDVIEASAWSKPGALKQYLSNPIILAFHDHRKPIGKMIEHSVDAKGLHIVAEISKAAGDVFNLIKDGVLTTFSVGFRVLDADWDSKADLFRIKEVELFETSVVSVPANANATFSVSKSFNTEDESTIFKQQFETTIEEENEMPQGIDDNEKQTSKPGMTKEEVAIIVAKSLEAFEARKEAKKAAEKATADAVSGAVTTATDRLEADFAKKLKAQGESTTALEDTIAAMAGEIKEAKESLDAAMKNKMQYGNQGDTEITKEQANNAILLGLAMNKNMNETKMWKDIVEKSGGQHVPTTTGAANANLFWEEQFTQGLLMELQDVLKVSPLFTSISMPSATYMMPVNPRNATDAAWVTNANLRGANSTGTAADHQLEDIVLVAKKLAAKTYVGYEEEEDAIIPILPFIRENLVRRMAEAKDESLLLGTASSLSTSADGISGLLDFATPVETGVIAASGTVTVALFRTMRAAMGIHGLNQNDLVYIVSTEAYYDLLEDVLFQTLDKVGERATFLSGEVGKISNIPVVVSDRFPTKANDAVFGALVYRKNYVLGELRGLMTETDKDIEEQKNIIVTTQRMAFEEIETGVGIEFIKYDTDGI